MKYSTKVADAVHILLLIYNFPNEEMSSTIIAKSIQTNPSYVRQIMMVLRNADMLKSRKGAATPIIARPLEEITLLDLYRALESDKPLQHIDANTNPACHVGMNIQQALGQHYHRVQQEAEEAMGQITLADVYESYLRNAHTEEERAPVRN